MSGVAEKSDELARQEAYTRFLSQFRLKMTPTDLKRLGYTYDMAEIGHKHQFRASGEPYFTHLTATVSIMVHELDITDAELLMGGLLHDIIEESHLLNVERIEMTFGSRVAHISDIVTKPKKYDRRFSSDSERHAWYFQRITDSDADCWLVKLPDNLGNMRTIEYCTPEKQRRKIKETRLVYLPLIEKLAVEFPEQAAILREQFRIALDIAEKKLSQL